MSRSMRWTLRKTIGLNCATEGDFKKARDALWATMPQLQLAESSVIEGVTSSPHEACEYMINKAAHLVELLPIFSLRKNHVITTCSTNDGCNQNKKLQHRSLHAMLLRVLSIGRKCQDTDYVFPLSLHDCSESAHTFMEARCSHPFVASRMHDIV